MAATEQQPDVAEATEEEAPSGGFKARLPIIAAIVVGLAIGGGSGAAVIGPVVVRKLHLVPAAKTTDSTAAEGDSAAAEGGDHEGKPGEKGAANAPAVQLIENLVLNPAGSGGSRFLLLSVAIECLNAKGVEELQARDAEVRDIILSTLGTKTVEQLSDVTTRESLKTEITNAISERIGAKRIKRLYFPQFVVQ